MASKRITDLSEKTTPEDGDFFAIVDETGTPTTKKISYANLFNAITNPPAHIPTFERGVGLSGLEFGSVLPGNQGTNYFQTVEQDFTYFASKGLTLVRLPFLWERLQPVLNGALDATYKGYIDNAITYAKNHGMRVILDVHNFGRYTEYVDGGITVDFTSETPALIYPWADYSRSGSIVLRDYGQSLLGTFANPVSGDSYKISFNMKFNSKDSSFGGEGLQIKTMWTDDNNCYNFNADLADGTWSLSKIVAGTTTVLASGSKTWGTSSTYAIIIDVNQATNGKINVKVDGSALYTADSVNSDGALAHGKVAFYAPGVHVRLDTMVLNISGDTSSGGSNTYAVGTTQVPIASFADLWSKIASAYAAESGIFMYDLMNEWHDMPVETTPSNYLTTATATLANQAAITAIRLIDINHYIAIESTNYSGLQRFTDMYGSNPTQWWTDTQNKTMISFHYYFDEDHSGTYSGSWSQALRDRISGDATPALDWALANSIKVFIGEYGVPNGGSNDDVNWRTDMDTFLSILDHYEAYGSQWAGGSEYSAVTTLEPTTNYTVDQAQMAIITKHLGD